MVRELGAADTQAALELLRARPLRNVFLEHVVRSGILGRVPGFYGHERDGVLASVVMIGPQGGTALEVRDPDAHGPLARYAAALPLRPRHIVGDEEVTRAFWAAYEPQADPLIWTRREPVYRIDRNALRAAVGKKAPARLIPAAPRDLDDVVANSAQQHVEDLDDDRFAADPDGFRERHARDLHEQRWWVLRERRRICFQVHVGPENAHTVQIGGVFTPTELRGRGYATRGVTAIAARLLERRPSVTLYCSEDNAAARSVYERIGFRRVFYNRSYLLEAPKPCPSSYA